MVKKQYVFLSIVNTHIFLENLMSMLVKVWNLSVLLELDLNYSTVVVCNSVHLFKVADILCRISHCLHACVKGCDVDLAGKCRGENKTYSTHSWRQADANVGTVTFSYNLTEAGCFQILCIQLINILLFCCFRRLMIYLCLKKKLVILCILFISISFHFIYCRFSVS